MAKKLVIFGVLLSLLLFWEYLGRASSIVDLLCSRPTLVWLYAVKNRDLLGLATWYTFVESICGLFFALIFSFGVMGVCFYAPRLLDIVLPTMVVSQVIPLITLAPFFIMILGIGLKAKIAMAALLCFFPIFVNCASGYLAIPQTTRELMYLYNAPVLFQILRINIPLMLPNILAGLKISATLSVIGAIVAEFNGAEYGLGKNLFLAAKRLEPELMMSSILLASAAGGMMYMVVRLIEKRLGKWYL